MKKLFLTLLVLLCAIAQVNADTWTVAGSSTDLFGTAWDPSNTANDMVESEGIFIWEKKGFTVNTMTDFLFKVVKDHNWGTEYPSENYEANIPAAGTYDLKITFNSSSHDVTFTATAYATISSINIAGGFNSWSWSANPLTLKPGEANVYTAEVATIADTEFGFQVNGTWMGYSAVGAENIDAPDGWVSQSGSNFKLNRDADYSSYTVTATWTPNPTATSGWTIKIEGKDLRTYEEKTVTYVDGHNWTKVYAYIYPDNDYKAWSGYDISESKTPANIGGTDYYLYTFTYKVYEGGTAPTNIIFNNNDGGQTPDLYLVPGKQYKDGITISEYVLAGDAPVFGGWDAENSTQVLTDNGDGTYSYSIEDVALAANTTFGFKVVDIANSALVWYPADENVTYTVNDAATYDFDIAFNPNDGNPVAIVGKRHVTIDAAGFTSFSSAHYLDWSTVENAAPYMATLTGETGNKKALLSKVTATNAGQGALIKGNPGAIAKPVIASVTNTFEGNLFVATNGAIAGSTDDPASYNYVYSAAPNPGFYKLTDDLDAVKANGAYLHTTEPLAAENAGSRVSWIFDDEVTGISQIENTQPATVKNTVVYNLNGQRVMNPAKGLYIVNGKKVIIK